MKLFAIWHYSKEDIDCTGVYYSISLLLNNSTVKVFSNELYDHIGSDRMYAFIEGMEWATGNKIDVVHQYRNDMDFDRA